MTNWVELARDQETGVETIRAHFVGHAYDPHWHPQYILGVTEHGHQQFHCRRKEVNSHQGHVFMLEPEELHDGFAPQENGFTYQMLYFDPRWLHERISGLFTQLPDGFELSVPATLQRDPILATRVMQAFHAFHYQEMRMMKETSIDLLLQSLVTTDALKLERLADISQPILAQKIRDMLHDHLYTEIGLDDLAEFVGIDRFRMNRIFKATYHMAPYQYLLQLRLSKARYLIASGVALADVASTVCFSDQRHLGRWFRRCYGMTPSNYQKLYATPV